jgi:dihydrofolate reductase
MLSLIVALTDAARVIGRAGGLPWRLSEDLKRFKRLTMGHHIVMGRKTYESIGRPLPGRTSIVVSRQQQRVAPSASVKFAGSLEVALALAGDDPEVFVIGGGELFGEALPRAEKAYVTWVDADLEGDTFFPEFPTPAWKQLSDEYIPQDDKNEFPTRFRIYQRIDP